MPDSVYSQLANRLNLIPGGFPRTESGVELRLLEKLFTPEQAKLALSIRLRADSPEKIANRAGTDPEETRQLLDQMVDDGLIRDQRGKNGRTYGLMPFVVGIYEMNLHRIDVEMAELFEAYTVEAAADFPIFDRPSVHRVIPVGESIPAEITVHPHEEAAALVEGAKAWGVRDCICRVQQKLLGKGCDHPVEICLTFSDHEGAFDDSPVDRVLTKAEALQLLVEAREAGLIHTTGNYRDGVHYICNCCTCSCGVLRGLTEFKIPTAVAHSDFVAVVDVDLCSGCGDCSTRCEFNAIDLPEGVAVIDAVRCLGCGQCVTVCEEGAMSLARREGRDHEPLPDTLTAWMLRRGMKQGRSFLDVL
ncbi:MAG: 4Fe-4S binding protein [Anaerolineae bacterium]|nr:4Fe-4S binding protein [Anaerolineae bacterium]